MFNLKDITEYPNKLAPYYSMFNVPNRILLTGHSHQAWPDAAFDAQIRAFTDAALYVDDKWERAFQKAENVRKGYLRLLGDEAGSITLSSNTHDLVVRFLSALNLRERKKIVTSDSEFHSIRRQLDRLAEEGIEIIKVPVNPMNTFIERVIGNIDENVSAVMLSKVFYNSGRIAPSYTEIMSNCEKKGVYFLVDVYHVLNVVPFSVKQEKLENAFIVGGGYKYCQLGEGNSFMRFPENCSLRPVITGWFSEFGTLSKPKILGEVLYGKKDLLFAGATYDPVSHYRASAVFEFFKEHNLNAEFLRQVSRHQIKLLCSEFDKLDADERIITRDRSYGSDEIAGFLVLITPFAELFYYKLKASGVLTDFRGNALRFGPAPYISDDKLIEAIYILSTIITEIKNP